MAKFDIFYNMADRGLPTLFTYRYFTIDCTKRTNWDYNNLAAYLGKYTLQVHSAVAQKYADDPVVSDILAEIAEAECTFSLSKNKHRRYGGENQYIRCMVPVFFLTRLKRLFVSTLVYKAAQLPLPQPESIRFLFDSVTRTVEIVDLDLYVPADNPYFSYARNAAASLSVEAIGLEQYTIKNNGKVNDFYNLNQLSGWKERKSLKSETALDKPGIYMLYDANRNTFYIGKAIRLQDRILAHAANPDDPIPDFTHYRYSVISGEYYEFLYLIENAAIHDAAWLLEMPTAKKYRPCLVKKVQGVNLNTCKMVNTVEHQTRGQNKQ